MWNRVLAFREFPVRRDEHLAPVINADTPGKDDFAVCCKRFSQVRLVKPDDADIARFVADDGLGTAASAGPRLACLPDVGDDGLLFAFDQLRRWT